MFIVFYFKNIPGCLLIPRPATTVPHALLPRHISPSPTPPELRRCVATVPGRLHRGTAPATGHCYRLRDLAPEACGRHPSPSWGLQRCADTLSSRASHCAVRRAAADVAAVIVDRGGHRPDPCVLPPVVRRCGVAVAVARGLALNQRVGDCCCSWHLAPEAHATSTTVGGRIFRGVFPQCAAALPSSVGHCAVRRATSVVAAIVVGHGDPQPDPCARCHAVVVVSSRGEDVSAEAASPLSWMDRLCCGSIFKII